MNTSAEQAWSQAQDPMAHMATDLDDLSNLFEFGDIDLNTISQADGASFGDHLQDSIHSNSTSGFDQLSPQTANLVQDFGGHDQFALPQDMNHQQQQQQHYAGTNGESQMPTGQAYSGAQYHPAMYQQHQPQAFMFPQGGFPPGNQVPPTPNSYEMHGEAGRFMQQQQQQLHQQIDPQQQALLEQRYQMRKNEAVSVCPSLPRARANERQVAFTPMVSPAGTPLYNMQPEFTMPGAYFSPLTSPMLHAQNAQNTQQLRQHQQGYYTNPSTAPSSNATSPIDPSLDVDMLADGLTLPERALPALRKSKRKPATPRSIVMNARLRQSPITKPQKRKSGSMLSSVVPSIDADAISRSGTAPPTSAGLQMPPAFQSSEEGSISPEPLSEALMGPPPRPTQSPALIPQQQQSVDATSGAATPKSILSIKSNARVSNGNSDDANDADGMEALDDLQLPGAARGGPLRPTLAQLEISIPDPSADNTPRLSARKTPKLGPSDTPSSARPSSALASPSIAGSPMPGSTPAVLLKDGKTVRNDKKRSSKMMPNSTIPSPALRPRISPSIKPLLPEGALHSPTHALLLASKSNYQNLLEGNHLPGVSYPDSLSTGLTSKRTSHKVAEQGRRNRINDALKEMQALLPPKDKAKLAANSKDTSDESPEAGLGIVNGRKETKEEAAARSNSSKAATVESANEYIKRMQKERAMQDAELAKLREEVEEMRKLRISAAAGKESDDSASPSEVKVQ